MGEALHSKLLSPKQYFHTFVKKLHYTTKYATSYNDSITNLEEPPLRREGVHPPVVFAPCDRNPKHSHGDVCRKSVRGVGGEGGSGASS